MSDTPTKHDDPHLRDDGACLCNCDECNIGDLYTDGDGNCNCPDDGCRQLNEPTC